MNALDLTILTTFNVLWPKEKQTEEKSVKNFWADSEIQATLFLCWCSISKAWFLWMNYFWIGSFEMKFERLRSFLKT